ncbi:hypothetical protein [Tardiphaga sp. 862_B3_N1_1]|uniref:hypothetical protein n=1 Tax=Tardiphaga sp. 862_B3_N1_1 TaxID=3240763 RepID=UPI003F8A8C01
MAKRIYLTEDNTGTKRLIKASTGSTAVAHHARDAIKVRVATQADLVQLLSSIPVEEAGAEPAPQPNWTEADTAYDNYYHKIKADMGRDEWRALWAKGQAPSQIGKADAPAAPPAPEADALAPAQSQGGEEGEF